MRTKLPVRKHVALAARLMELQLRRHDAKKGDSWTQVDPNDLLYRAYNQVDHARDRLIDWEYYGGEYYGGGDAELHKTKLIIGIADAMNYLAMALDQIANPKEKKEEPEHAEQESARAPEAKRPPNDYPELQPAIEAIQQQFQVRGRGHFHNFDFAAAEQRVAAQLFQPELVEVRPVGRFQPAEPGQAGEAEGDNGEHG